jgi:putative peptidoglycan lipid II flippase
MALVLNMVLNIIFVVTLVRAEFYAPHVGLALATTISALFNATLLYRGLRRDGVYVPRPGWGRFTIQVAVASGVMIGAVLWARGQAGDWLVLSSLERAGALAACVVGGMIVYFLACYLAGLTPASLREQRPQAQP